MVIKDIHRFNFNLIYVGNNESNHLFLIPTEENVYIFVNGKSTNLKVIKIQNIQSKKICDFNLR